MASPAGPHARPEGPPGGRTRPLAPHRSDRTPWNWLLVLPILVPLLVPLYNRQEPTLFGWPFFYWVQLCFVALGVLCTSVVYRASTRAKARELAAERNRAAGATDGGR